MKKQKKSFSTYFTILFWLLIFFVSGCSSPQTAPTPNISEMAVEIASTMMAMTAQAPTNTPEATPTLTATAVPIITEVQNSRIKLDESGRLFLSGFVVNIGSQPIQGIGIKIILKDKNGNISSEKFDLACYIPVGGKSPFNTLMGYGELDYSGGIFVSFGQPVFASQEMVELVNSLEITTTGFLDYGNGQGEIYGVVSNIGQNVIPYPMIGGYLIDNNGFVETMIPNGGGMVIQMNKSTLLPGETFKFLGSIDTPNPTLPNLSPVAYLPSIPMPGETGACGLTYKESGEFIPSVP